MEDVNKELDKLADFMQLMIEKLEKLKQPAHSPYLEYPNPNGK